MVDHLSVEPVSSDRVGGMPEAVTDIALERGDLYRYWGQRNQWLQFLPLARVYTYGFPTLNPTLYQVPSQWGRPGQITISAFDDVYDQQNESLGSKNCNTAGRTVWIIRETVLKNKSQLVILNVLYSNNPIKSSNPYLNSGSESPIFWRSFNFFFPALYFLISFDQGK